MVVSHCHLRRDIGRCIRWMTEFRKTMVARIYKPAKTAMQSGQAKTKDWVLDYEPSSPREVEPLMGWTSSGDMLSQVRLFFETKEEAVAFAQENGIPFRVFEPHPRGL